MFKEVATVFGESITDSKELRNKLRKYYSEILYKCYVTGSTENLQLHHNYPLKTLIKNNSLTKEKLLDVVYLTKQEHQLLHFLFGRNYDEAAVPKVKEYLRKRKYKKLNSLQ